jgi:hypothetical protein
MDPRVRFVDEILGFIFDHGFARKFEEVGSPANDLEFWYRNAMVFKTVTDERPIPDQQRTRLVTLIEAVRLDAMSGPISAGEPMDAADFDLSAYEFSEDLLLYKQRVVDEVLRQEALSPSTIDPILPEGGLVN